VTTMKRLDSNEIMDYLDGSLDAAHRAQIEAHLAQDAEDRALVAEIRAAMGALNALDELEPVRAGDDFWMKVRDNLPAKAPRRSWTTQLGAMLWPQTSRPATALRVAVIAGIMALASQWFAPQQDMQPIQASLPPEARMFVNMSSQKHAAYVSSQPLTGAPVGAPASVETGDEDDDTGGSTP
jgi:anti-sigma factor RsiW